MPAEALQRGKKRDTDAPRGISRHPSGGWAIRFTCGAGCKHKERVGPLKSEAVRMYHERRNRAQGEPGWCPNVERREARSEARAERAREKARITFRAYALDDYLPSCKSRLRGAKTVGCRVHAMVAYFGDVKLDQITPADVERYLNALLAQGLTQATHNRYRSILSAMFGRAMRFGLVSANPVKGSIKYREPEGRTLYLLPADKAQEEAAIRDALRPDLRPLFITSVNTGFRWSEQIGLEWRDVDFFSGSIGVQRSKSGYSRTVPMNSVVRSVLMDLAAQRTRPDDPSERVFKCTYVQADKFFPAAVERASKALLKTGQDVSRLNGYTWHCNRHTFASRLVMRGVDLYTVQRLGGWRTPKMVQRYAHLAPEHLREAVERLVPDQLPSMMEVPRKCPEISNPPVDAL